MWSIEQIVGIKRNAEQTTPLDLFLAGMSSVMVTISTCASPYIPTVIIKSISVLLHGAELHSCSYSNSLFVDYWQDTGTCQQHVRETASLSVESHHEGWHFPLYALSLSLSFLSLSRPLWGTVRRQPQALCWQEISWQAGIFLSPSRMTSPWRFHESNIGINHWYQEHLHVSPLQREKQLRSKDINEEKEHAAREKRSSCLDLLQ